MATKRNYLSQTQLAQYADITITDSAEMDDRIDQAEEIIDAYVGPQEKAFCDVLEGLATGGGGSTLNLQAEQVNMYEQDYFIYCLIEIMGGTGAGQQRRITASTKAGVLTVHAAWDTVPDSTSFYRIYQLGKFPRKKDEAYYSTAEPFRYYRMIPDAVRKAVAAQVEYMLEMGTSFFASNKMNMKRERIDDYEYENNESSPASIQALIAPKAKQYLRGIYNRKGAIIT